MTAVFLDYGSLSRGDINRAPLEKVVSPWRFYDETSADELEERIKDAEIIVSNKVRLDENAIAAAEKLKLICVAATGYDNIDLSAAGARQVPVCNVRAYATPSVVQHVFMLMLNLCRRFVEYQELVHEGGWHSSVHFCPLNFGIEELTGKTLGIIGYGELGQSVAAAAKAFGMELMIAEHKGKTPRTGRTAFDELLAKADIITLHCPLTEQTRDLISNREFKLMKPTAFLINAARGGVVNERDLLDSLLNKQIAGAAVDVLMQEPPSEDSLLLSYQQANLIITPHIAWASKASRQRLLNQLADNINGFQKGTPFNQVN